MAVRDLLLTLAQKTNSRSLGPIPDRKRRGWPRDDNVGECGGVVFAIHQQIHLAGEASERGHHGAAVVIFDDELRNENRVGEIGERIVKALRRVHATQSVEIGGRVFADEQGQQVRPCLLYYEMYYDNIAVREKAMASPFSLRLDHKTRQRIARLARRSEVSASDIVRSAIESMADREESRVEPYQLVADLIGVARGRNPRHSEQTGRRFAKLLKHRRKAK